MPRKAPEIAVGTQFEDLTTISEPYKDINDNKTYRIDVKCKCGEILSRQIAGLRNGTTKRCANCVYLKKYGETRRDFNNPT